MRLLLRSAGLAVALAVAALPARAETLADTLVTAYNNSNLLDQNRALLRAADEDVAVALSALRPVLSWVANAGYSESVLPGNDLNASISISLDLLLYDFGRSKLSTELARESVLAARDALVNIEQNVLFTAVQAYMAVLRTSEFVTLRQNNVRLITQELRAARDRFELGEVTLTDVSIAEARLALSRANLAAAEGDLATARELFAAAVGRPPGSLASAPEVPRLPASLEEARGFALRNHPTILQAQHLVTVSELGIAIAEAAMKPTLSMGASTSLNDELDVGNSLSLRMSGPIYQGGRLSAQYRRAVAQRDAQRAALLQQSRIVAQNVGVAWSDLAVAAAQLEASDGQIRAASVAYRGVREEATLGARTTLDVLNAEQELLDAQAGRISAYTDYYVATYGVLREMGLLTAEHLKLNVVIYDPQAYYNAVKGAPVRKVSPQGQKLDRILKGLNHN